MSYLRDKVRKHKYQWTAIQSLGGQCEMCGMEATEDNMIIFDFHHIEPKEKEYSVSRLISTGLSWKRIEKEISKCILFCACCHRLHHQKYKPYLFKGN